jgi:hypothetical protein
MYMAENGSNNLIQRFETTASVSNEVLDAIERRRPHATTQETGGLSVRALRRHVQSTRKGG